MRARNIKPGFFRNEQLLKTSPLGRLLFAGLWCLADREGRLPDRPAQIKWDILPADDCDVSALLDELALRGFIRRYTAGDARYIEVTRFLAHQKPHYKEKASIIPPPPDTTPAQKHDSTLPDILIPDSLIPDSPIPDTLLPADTLSKGSSTATTPSSEAACSLSDTPKKGTSATTTTSSEVTCSLSDMPSKGKSTTGTPLSEVACSMPTDMPKKDSSTASTASSEAKSKRSTDRKANYFFSRQDGNTNRSQPCKQVKHASDWVTGFFAT